MPNPFPSKFNSECQNCQNHVDRGDSMYAHDGMFICQYCAEEGDLICPECKAYKKEQFKTCFSCKQSQPMNMTEEEVDDWMNGDIVEQVRKKKKDNELPF